MKKALDFKLNDQNGNVVSLSDFKGSWVVVYFYPKDNTPGCTKEACSFRDGRDLLKTLGVEVIGISKDSEKSHEKFSNIHKLNFPILSDPTTETIQAFGSWKNKKFMGREYMGISRDTYLINPDGEIVKKYEGVNPLKHFDEVLEDLKTLISL